MFSTTKDYGVLVGVDGSAQSDAAVRFATRESTIRNAPLTLIHVVEPAPAWATSSQQSRITQARQDNAREVIEQAQKTAHANTPASVRIDLRTEVVCSPVAAMLVVASTGAQMVVVGSRGSTRLDRLLLGSVSATLTQYSHCPVAVVHDDDGAKYPKRAVVVGVDGSAACDPAVALAFDEASRRGVCLIALHAWSDVGVLPILGMDWRDYEARGAEVLAERLAGYQEKYPDVRVHRRLVCDKPVHWLLEEAEMAQLVVVGARGRGGFPDMLLGSVSSALVQATKVPVIIAR